MAATIIPFPVLEGALCMVEPRRNPHRNYKKPARGCMCEACEMRREELKIAEAVEAELIRARDERDALDRWRNQLERDAG